MRGIIIQKIIHFSVSVALGLLFIFCVLPYTAKYYEKSVIEKNSEADAAEINNSENNDSNEEKKSENAQGLPKVIFSEEAGFYDNPFILEMNISDAENIEESNISNNGSSNTSVKGYIYYTLDGSIPTVSSNRYEAGLEISDASKNPNKWSDFPGTSAYFYKDLKCDENNRLTTSYNGLGFNVDKCTVVKAVFIDEDGNMGPLHTASYFVGLKNKEEYKNIRVASISFEPDNLFGYEDGIYVTGKDFDKWFADHDYGKSVKSNSKWQYWSANYTRSGKNAEREVTVEIFDETGKLITCQNAGARVQGNVSRGTREKSLGLYAHSADNNNFDSKSSDNTALSGKFSDKLFSDGNSYTAIELYAGSMEKTRIRNYLGQTLAKDLNFSTIESIPCALFLEGEYWGLYDLGPRYNEGFIAEKYGIKEDNVIFVKNGEVKSEGKNDIYYFREVTSFCAKNDMRNPFNYKHACSLIDIDSYIDYYATMIYWARNGDWPGTNYAMFRSRKADGEGYNDGKWRWMLFDLDKLCYNKELTDYDNVFATINGGGEMENMFASLLKNNEFRQKFHDRLIELSENEYSSQRVDEVINDYLEKCEPAIMLYHKRFDDEEKYTVEKLHEEIDGIRYFFENRRQYIDALSEQYF